MPLRLFGLGFGFFCSTADGRITTNRKMRLKNLSRERLVEAVSRNARDLVRLVEMSKEMGLSTFRVGSDLIPFASHPLFDEGWLSEVRPILEEAGRRIAHLRVRLTMHPGQFVVLSSPDEEVVSSSLRELEYHFWVLDVLGAGEEGVVVVHLGGTRGDKDSSVRRFLSVLEREGWLRRRLALENDERDLSAEEALLVAEAAGIPMVFDHYHHRLNPSPFDPERVLSTWGGRTPEMHLSSAPREGGRRGEHGEWVDLEDALELARLFEGAKVDVVVEAKGKEKAVKKLLQEAASRGLLEETP